MMGTEFVRVIYVFELLFLQMRHIYIPGGKSKQELLKGFYWTKDHFVGPVVPSVF